MKRNTEFEKLQIIEPLSYFEHPISTNSNYGASSITGWELLPYVFDIPTGNISELTSDFLKEMIGKDADSLKQSLIKGEGLSVPVFDNSVNKTIYKYCLLSLYKRDNECRTSLRNHLGVLALIDFIKKQNTDTTYMAYYNRLMNELNGNPYFSKVKLVRKDYSYGNCKSIGIVAYQAEMPFYIGIWSYFDPSGKCTRFIEYTIDAKKIREENYNL